LPVLQEDARNFTLLLRDTPAMRARNRAVRIPAPSPSLCRVFPLVRPCELRTCRWHTEGCRECPRATSGKNPKSSASRTLFLAKGHAAQPPSRLGVACCPADDSATGWAIFHGCPSASRSARLWLASLASKCPPLVPRNTLPEQGLLLRTEYSSVAPFALYRRLLSR